MGVIEDVRKVVQDLVAPELKSLGVKLDNFERESKLRDESLATEAKVRDELTQAKLEAIKAKIDGLGARMDAQYQSLLYNLNLEKRVGLLERDKQSASA